MGVLHSTPHHPPARSSALVQAGRSAEAVAVARAGLEVLPDNAAVKEALRMAEAVLAQASNPPAPAPSPSSSGSAWRAGAPGASSASNSRTGGSSGAAPGQPNMTAPSTATTVVMASRLFVLACTVAYLVPLGAISLRAYTLAHVAALVAHLALIYLSAGAPQWNQEVGAHGGCACEPDALLRLCPIPEGEQAKRARGSERIGPAQTSLPSPPPSHVQYAMRVFECVWTPLTFTSLIALGYHPSLLLLFAAAGCDLLAAGDTLYQWAQRSAPPLASLMVRGTDLALPYLLGVPATQAATLSVRERWSRVNEGALEMGAVAEVIAAIAMVVEMLTPARSMLSVIMMWQLLQMKFTMSSYTRSAFTRIDARISGLLAAGWVPAPLRTGYASLRGFLRSRVHSPEEMRAEAERRVREGTAGTGAGAGAGGGIAGALQRCAVQ